MNVRASPLKTIATLAALIYLFPLSVTIVAFSALAGGVRSIFGATPSRPAPGPRKNVLVSGGKMTKALQLARSFHAAGHRVVLCESHRYWLTGHRFSRAVDRFATLPVPGSAGYVDALIALIERERIDVYVPVCSPAASIWDSQAMPRVSEHCEVVHVGPDTIERLDDKYAFARAAQSLGLRAPKSFLVTSHADVLAFDFREERRPYILKSIAYDSIRRLDLTHLPRATVEETETFVRSLPISPDRPWVMQEYIAGTEYCTHGTLRAGELRVHCCCRSSAFQINYEHEDRPDIEDWVRRFGEALGLTGQVSMDFIEAADDGQIYAIECNPRTHSAITMLYDNPGVAAAYLGGPLGHAPIRPLASSRPTYWFYHELWRLLASLGSARRTFERLRVIARGKDAVLDWRDPLPFLMLHHWHVPLLLLNELRERRGWLRIDFNIGKLVQPGGRLNVPLRILQLVGSPTSDFYRELSELYARGSLEALAVPDTYHFAIAHVAPDGAWRFPESLASAALASAPRRSLAEAIGIIGGLAIDAAIPQMFCRRGMTDMRALLDVMAIPYLGNTPLVMALAADKAKAKAVVASAGVDVPRSQVVRAGDAPQIGVPAVVKPNDADNSDGVTLVRTQAAYADALQHAFAFSDVVLVEEYIELGREVRCGIVERRGEFVCLPLEEYFVDADARPIRRAEDKLKRRGGGDLTLVAKTRTESWIVPPGDPVIPAVWEAARRSYVALGCRQYGLFDFRVDASGRPWFLEAGPYCSYAPSSVIVTMMDAAGTPLSRFFAEALGELLAFE